MCNSKVTKRRGQSTLEYCVVIAIVVIALITMQTYIKRSIQGKLREAADDIGEQYDPRNTSAAFDTTTTSDVTTTVWTDQVADKLVTTTYIDIKNEEVKTTGEEKVGSFANSYWP